jgi:class 3 adenylate cyclase/tetratricopeptide (TPR) repeat protein
MLPEPLAAAQAQKCREPDNSAHDLPRQGDDDNPRTSVPRGRGALDVDNGTDDTAHLRPYAPRLLIEWLHEAPEESTRLVDGSVVFADISGFTRLSERLAARGRVGAEELTDAISRCFEELLAVAYDNGASLLKFGGDATLLLFTGEDHVLRACLSAGAMRQALRELGTMETSGTKVNMRISMGVHSGEFPFFLLGSSHRELVLTGPSFTQVVEMESAADAGEIVISAATAAALPRRSVGRPKGPGFLLAGVPLHGATHPRIQSVEEIRADVVARGLSTAVRSHLAAGIDEPEHRQVTVAFLHFDGTDETITASGVAAVADHLDALVRQVQHSADKHGVCVLGTDVDHDGGKIILVAGAPTATGEDEQSMLLVLREVLEAEPSLPVRIGVNAGHVFVGSVGPHYRRTYTVMGDAVNLAARVMAKARPGQLLATDAVLDRSAVRFATTPLEPFPVKGKTALVQAYDVGPALMEGGAVVRSAPPFIGRETELQALRELLERARLGTGSLVELVGEAGLGKTRLVEELMRSVTDVRVLSATCAAYQSLSPYFPFRTLLRQALVLPESATPVQAGDRLLGVIAERAPELLPWAPLIAIPIAAEVPPTPEVDKLDERFMRTRLHNVVTTFLGVLLDGPTIVAVDDVHWSDEASADLLHRIRRDVAKGPWLICVTRRDLSTGFVAPEGPDVVTLRPPPLGDHAARELADELADADPLAHHLSPHDLGTLAAQSGGNPLFLAELVASAASAGGVDELPSSVEALIMARIDRLAPPDRALLRRLSVFGQTCDHGLVTAALGDEAPPLESTTWNRLAEFVAVQGATLRFEHGLVRDGAYASTPFRLRQSLHARIGAALEARADNPESVAALLSLHYFHANRYGDAWRYSHSAALQARAVHANVEAVEFYERALVSAQQCDSVTPLELESVYEDAGDLYSRLGKYSKADSAYRLAKGCAATDEEAQVRLLLKRGELRQRFGHYPAALRWLGKARRLAMTVDGTAGHQLLGSTFMAVASVAKDQARHKDAITWCRRAIALAGPARDKATLAHAYSVHDGSCSVLGRLDQAQFGDQALSLYTELGDLRGQGMAHSNLGLLSIMRGRWDEGLDHWDKSQAALRAVGDEVNVAIISANMAEARLEQGRLEEAERFLRQATRVWSAAGDRASLAYAARLLARVEARRGDTNRALERLAQARADFEAVQAEDEALETSARVAECLVLAGRAEEAFDVCTQLLNDPHDLEQFHPLLYRVLGFAYAQNGDSDAARTCFERSLTTAEHAGTDVETAQTLRALVRLAGGADEESALRSALLFEGLGVVAPCDPPLGDSDPALANRVVILEQRTIAPVLV